MKVRFLFHTPLGERGVGKLIVGWTWLLGCFYNWKVLKYNFSHVEIWIPDETGRFESLEFMTKKGIRRSYFGQCFSSTTRGDANGVRFAPANKVLKHPERWEYIEVEVDPERYEVELAEAKRLIGGRYDYGYILSFMQPFIIQSKFAWACSEICAWVGYLWGIIPKQFKRISPRRLAYILAKKYGEPKPLV